MKNRKLLIITTFILFLGILLYLGLGYFSSYVGYYGYNKDKIRRFSESIKESESRAMFIKSLNFSVYPDSFIINSAFIEKGYKWGSSSNETRELNQKDTVEGNWIDMPYQVVVSFPNEQFNGIIRLGSMNTQLYYKPYFPLKVQSIKDTVYFHLIYSSHSGKGFGGIVKVWESFQ
jgi:hypothetical protein